MLDTTMHVEVKIGNTYVSRNIEVIIPATKEGLMAEFSKIVDFLMTGRP